MDIDICEKINKVMDIVCLGNINFLLFYSRGKITSYIPIRNNSRLYYVLQKFQHEMCVLSVVYDNRFDMSTIYDTNNVYFSTLVYIMWCWRPIRRWRRNWRRLAGRSKWRRIVDEAVVAVWNQRKKNKLKMKKKYK